MLKILKVLDKINAYACSAAAWLFVPLVALTVFEVITRRFLQSPTIWTYEMTTFLFAPLVLLALGWTHLEKRHASIDVIHMKLNPKTQAWLEIITFVLLLGFSSFMIFIESYSYAAASWATGERTPSAFYAPIYLVKTFMPIGFFLLFTAGLSRSIKIVYFLINKEDIKVQNEQEEENGEKNEEALE